MTAVASHRKRRGWVKSIMIGIAVCVGLYTAAVTITVLRLDDTARSHVPNGWVVAYTSSKSFNPVLSQDPSASVLAHPSGSVDMQPPSDCAVSYESPTGWLTSCSDGWFTSSQMQMTGFESPPQLIVVTELSSLRAAVGGVLAGVVGVGAGVAVALTRARRTPRLTGLSRSSVEQSTEESS